LGRAMSSATRCRNNCENEFAADIWRAGRRGS
jgi:hypothetical protein